MAAAPDGISEADWLATPAAVRQLILSQREQIDQLRPQVSAMAAELASLRERIGRTSRNSSKPPSSNGPGFKPPEGRKGSGRKRAGQPGHPGKGPEPLPMERVDEVVEHLQTPAAVAAPCCGVRIQSRCGPGSLRAVPGGACRDVSAQAGQHFRGGALSGEQGRRTDRAAGRPVPPAVVRCGTVGGADLSWQRRGWSGGDAARDPLQLLPVGSDSRRAADLGRQQ